MDGGDRTHNLEIKNLLLYLVELRPCIKIMSSLSLLDKVRDTGLEPVTADPKSVVIPFHQSRTIKVVGVEPTMTGSEPGVMPFHYTFSAIHIKQEVRT